MEAIRGTADAGVVVARVFYMWYGTCLDILSIKYFSFFRRSLALKELIFKFRFNIQNKKSYELFRLNGINNDDNMGVRQLKRRKSKFWSKFLIKLLLSNKRLAVNGYQNLAVILTSIRC